MPTFTNNLGIELPANGELDGIWGGVVNENMDILDRAINGVLSLSLSGTSSTLTTSDGALSDGQYKLLLLTGSPSGTHTITLSPNDSQKIYFVRNTTAQSVVFTQGSGGNVTIATGDSGIIYANGGGASAAIANLTDHFAMSSVNITGGSITGLSDLGLSSAGPFIDFAETDTTDKDARISLSAGTLVFDTRTDADVLVQENMRIASNGNVGIGTAADAATKLEVSSNTNPTAVFIAFISGTTMTVTGITSGTLAVGDRVFGAGVEWNTVITAQLTGTTGASGTYSVNNSQTVSTTPGISMSSAPAGRSVLRLTNTDTVDATNQTTGGIEFYGSDASTPGAGVKGYVAVISESATPDSAMIFGTSDNTASTQAVERMRIDSVGNVGIGTKSPATALDVVGAITATGNLTVDTNTLFVDATNDRVGINTIAPLVTLEVSGSTGELFRISAATDAGTQAIFGLGFATGTTTTNPAAAIYAQEFDASDLRAGLNFFTRGVQTDTAPTQRLFISDQGVVTIFALAGTGSRTVTAGSAGALSAASDSRLKHEVSDAPIPGLAEIMQLEPRAYQWLDEIEKRGEDAAVEIGFFADQVKDIIPSAAPLGNDGYYGFYDRAVIAALTKAVQEQQAIINALEARLTALEAQVQ